MNLDAPPCSGEQQKGIQLPSSRSARAMHAGRNAALGKSGAAVEAISVRRARPREEDCENAVRRFPVRRARSLEEEVVQNARSEGLMRAFSTSRRRR